MGIRKGKFKPDDLEIVGHPTYEEIIVGDFVTLAHHSCIGIVKSREGEDVTVLFFADKPYEMTAPWMCFWQAAARVDPVIKPLSKRFLKK